MIIEPQKILNYLKKSADRDKVSHAYLLTGPDKFYKKQIAIKFAEHLGCQTSDITIISILENKKEILIEQIRELRRYLGLSSYGNRYKFAIIEEAESMNNKAANALLKTLEEPKGKTIIILIADKSFNLPNTIISRCEEIILKPSSLNIVFENFIQKPHIEILNKPLIDILKYIEKTSGDKLENLNLLNSWLFCFRKMLLDQKQKSKYSQEKIIKIMKKIEETKKIITNTNVNKKLALENLALEIYAPY